MPLTKTFFSPRFGMVADRFGVSLDGPCRAQGRGVAMRFMVMLKADKNTEAGVPPSTELLAEMGKYNEELAKAGVLLAGEGLQPSSKGARVKFSGEQADRHRRPVCRDAGADRRLLDVPGKFEGRGDRVGQALPRSAPGRRVRDRDPPSLRSLGFRDDDPRTQGAGRTAPRDYQIAPRVEPEAMRASIRPTRL